MAKDFFKDKTEWKLINGDMANKEPLGYCCYYQHYGYLTKGMIEEHKCLIKNCVHFKKNTQHKHWKRKEELKALKKAKRAGQSTYEFEGKIYLITKKI